MITYSTNDQVIAVTDPMGNTTHYDYSTTTGLLSAVTDAEGGVISYNYDWAGKLVKLTDQRGHSTTYAYDVFGRLVSETNSLNQTTSYAYDDAHGCGSCGGGGNGNLASVTDPAGRLTHYAYDAADRLTTVTYSGLSDMVVHTYNEHGRRVATFDNRLPTADFPTQTFTWTYDTFDRMLTETYPDGEVVAWTYDVNGRRTILTDPDGRKTRYYYYDLPGNKKLSHIASPFADATEFKYDNRGRLTEENNDTGYEKWYYFDALNRLYSVQTWGRDEYGSLDIMNPLSSFYLTFDAAGMIRQMSTSQRLNPVGWAVSRQRKYTYDNTYRLTGEERVQSGQVLWRDGYEYDLAGNRTFKHHFDKITTRTDQYHNNAFNQIFQIDIDEDASRERDYDASGNLDEVKRIGEAESYAFYGHNPDNKLSTFVPVSSDAGTRTGYVYDFSGRLLMSYDPFSQSYPARKYYYDGINTLIEKQQEATYGVGSPPPVLHSCWRTVTANVLKDAPIGQIITQKRWNYNSIPCGSATLQSTYIAYHYDHIGNVLGTSICDGLSTPLNAYDMDAFGNVVEGNHEGVHLTTKHYDPNSKLYYFGARWYDPAVGRWTQKEPLGLDGPNFYHFNFGNPVALYDRTGNLAVPAIIGGGILIAGVLGVVGSANESAANRRNCESAKAAQRYWAERALSTNATPQDAANLDKANKEIPCACNDANVTTLDTGMQAHGVLEPFNPGRP